ncbi:MAG: hypothetical protein O0V67_00275 [Methanocorpusculum sp.]|nr:hypothetical protein [Methanocorpusculum sp.]
MTINEKRRINATTHGCFGTPLYRVWNAMKQRCKNPAVKEYKYYGAKGISVCKEWEHFEKFRDWSLSNGYKQGLTLDRIDTCGNYQPLNCRWVTVKEQQRNKTNNVLLSFNGETHCAKEWSEILEIKYKTIMTRLARGYEIEKVLFKGDIRKAGIQ